MEKAMFGAGCFWGVETGFRQVEGVLDATVGYSGGGTEDPTYEQVCSGTTNHAEVVYLEYDPAIVSYERLLEVFWNGHDPTQLNRQGPDVGTQYRSAVYYYTDAQRDTAESSRKQEDESGRLRAPIATEILPAQEFYRGEEYHQQYFAKRGIQSCHFEVKQPSNL
ncbi:MAG TPA: peptide-methionine (S)-S-oxide reductase MsrA [Candidatus Hydrogenedentes bacterium]|nr:peptide-methionine (S)-S-oxide reductase MsrA [Candidatus Hydrogenedentota bacterium]